MEQIVLDIMDKNKVFKPLFVFVLLIFNFVIAPILSVMKIINDELGWKLASLYFLSILSLAWILYFVVFQTVETFFMGG